MKPQETNSKCQYEHFPYKSYEEILDAKRRRILLRKGFITVVLSLMLVLIIVLAIGIKIGGLPLSKSKNGIASSVFSILGGNNQTDPDGTSGMLTVPSEDNMYVVADVSQIVRAVRPSVVGVTCEQYSTFTQTSARSGIIISEDGYIITNHHVVENGDSISVTLDTGETYPAFIVGYDSFTDIAVIKIDADNLEPATFGDSDSLSAGQPAIAIGSTTGILKGTVTSGIISAINRNILVGNYLTDLIQTDTIINQSNSGGPLLNRSGEVIGMNSSKIAVAGYEGLSFAIPVNVITPVVEELMEKGYVSGRPLLGLSIQEISSLAAAYYNIPQGLLVKGVMTGSDACEQGLMEGDIIVEVNDVATKSFSSACTVRNSFTAGEEITVTFFRNGTEQTVKICLGENTHTNQDYNY